MINNVIFTRPEDEKTVDIKDFISLLSQVETIYKRFAKERNTIAEKREDYSTIDGDSVKDITYTIKAPKHMESFEFFYENDIPAVLTFSFWDINQGKMIDYFLYMVK